MGVCEFVIMQLLYQLAALTAFSYLFERQEKVKKVLTEAFFEMWRHFHSHLQPNKRKLP